MDAVLAFKAPTPNPAIPENITLELTGSYTFNGRKVEISNEEGKLILTLKRKMISFFELNTELYMHKVERLSTDIADVFLNYVIGKEGRANVTSIDWKGTIIEVDD